MADTVTTAILNNGPRNLVINFSNVSDGTGESGVTKVDATSATYAYKGVAVGANLQVDRIEYQCKALGLRILWDATSDTDLVYLEGQGFFDWSKQGGRSPTGITGATGSLLFTTTGAMLNSGYNVTLFMTKNFQF